MSTRLFRLQLGDGNYFPLWEYLMAYEDSQWLLHTFEEGFIPAGENP